MAGDVGDLDVPEGNLVAAPPRAGNVDQVGTREASRPESRRQRPLGRLAQEGARRLDSLADDAAVGVQDDTFGRSRPHVDAGDVLHGDPFRATRQ
jgi:hypothetical protein